MAKPTFCALARVGDRGVDADDLDRRASTSGPPELPGLIAASVWSTSSSALPVSVPHLAVQRRR